MVCVFKHLYCSAQLSISSMEKRYRNKIIIIIIITTFKLKLKAKRCPPKKPTFDLDKLKDHDVADVLQAQVGGKFAALTLIDSDVKTLTRDILTVVTTAEDVLGKRRKKIQPWIKIFFSFPSYISGVHLFWVRFLRM